MKRLLSSLFAFSLAATFFIACGDTTSTVPSSTSTNGATSVTSTSEALSVGQDTSDLSSVVTTIQNAAGISSSLPLTAADLTATGDISSDDVASFSGVQSMTYQQDGGCVYIVKSVSGKADAVQTGFTNMNDALLAQGENYKAEFPTAYANLENAVIKSEGNYIIYAVASNGDYSALSTAVDDALTSLVTA